MIQIPAMAILERIRRAIPGEVWLIVAAFALLIGFLFWSYRAGAGAEKDRQAVEVAKVERQASTGREKASTERFTDAASSQARLDQRNADAQALPDAVPDTRERSRRCRQLRDAGVRVPECG